MSLLAWLTLIVRPQATRSCANPHIEGRVAKAWERATQDQLYGGRRTIDVSPMKPPATLTTPGGMVHQEHIPDGRP